MLDFTQKPSSYSQLLEIPVATGEEVKVEGAALVKVLEGGARKVKLSTGAGGEVFVGFSQVRGINPSVRAVIEEAAVPAASPYTVQLANQQLVATQIRVYDATDDTDLTEGNPANPGEYSADDATGLLTFNAAQAENQIVVYYRHDLTVSQARDIYFEDAISRGEPSSFPEGLVGVLTGQGTAYTDQYDPKVDWTSGSPVRLGADGLFTIGGGGTPVGSVVLAPSASYNFLGLAYTAENLD